MASELALTVSGMVLDQTQHEDALGMAARFHRIELELSEKFHHEQLRQAVAHHKEDATAERRQFTARVNHQRIAADKEASRDRWQQQNETVQTMLIMGVLVFSVAFVLVVDGGIQLPEELTPMVSVPSTSVISGNVTNETTVQQQLGIDNVIRVMAGHKQIFVDVAGVETLVSLGAAEASNISGSAWGLLMYGLACSCGLVSSMACIVTLLLLYNRMTLYDFNHPLRLYPCCSRICKKRDGDLPGEARGVTSSPTLPTEPVRVSPPTRRQDRLTKSSRRSTSGPEQTKALAKVSRNRTKGIGGRVVSDATTGPEAGLGTAVGTAEPRHIQWDRRAVDGNQGPLNAQPAQNASVGIAHRVDSSSTVMSLGKGCPPTASAFALEESSADNATSDDEGAQTVAASTLFFSPHEATEERCCCEHYRHLTFQDYYQRHCERGERVAVILFYIAVEVLLAGVLVFQVMKYQYKYIQRTQDGVNVGETAMSVIFGSVVLSAMAWPLLATYIFPPPIRREAN